MRGKIAIRNMASIAVQRYIDIPFSLILSNLGTLSAVIPHKSLVSFTLQESSQITWANVA